jgi:hypothetical protein
MGAPNVPNVIRLEDYTGLAPQRTTASAAPQALDRDALLLEGTLLLTDLPPEHLAAAVEGLRSRAERARYGCRGGGRVSLPG